MLGQKGQKTPSQKTSAEGLCTPSHKGNTANNHRIIYRLENGLRAMYVEVSEGLSFISNLGGEN